MTSSPKLAPAPPAAATPVQPDQPMALPFPYREVTVTASRSDFSTGPGQSDAQALVTQVALREAQAREAGRQQGEREGHAKFEEQLARERSVLAKALQEFAVERAAYYQKIEQEAVQLALSIARKVLHREAQVDPMLLMGIVRVALEKIEGATGVVLAVHPQQAADWRRYLASGMDPGDPPEIVEDPALAPEQCELRTSMGTAELGLEVQLKEIEQGLMDLLAARPQEKEKP